MNKNGRPHVPDLERWAKRFDLALIKARYEAGENITALAEAFDTSLSTIHSILVALDVPRRPRGRPRVHREPKVRQPNVNGHRGTTSKITADDVVEMRRRYAAGESAPDLGAAYGVSHEGARKAISGKTWRHVPGAVCIRPHNSPRPDKRLFSPEQEQAIVERYELGDETITALAADLGVSITVVTDMFARCGVETDHSRGAKGTKTGKLTADDVRAIRIAYAAGDVYQSELAERYGVTDGAISHIITGHTWSDVS